MAALAKSWVFCILQMTDRPTSLQNALFPRTGLPSLFRVVRATAAYGRPGDDRVRHLHFGVGQPSLAPDGRQGRFLIRDTWNTDVISELQPKAEDVVLYKHRFSGFYQTELDDILRRLGINNLIFTGCTTSVCVDSTIRDAMFRDYRCVLLADCTGEPIGGDLARRNHEASLLTIQTLFGWVSSSERFVSAIEASAPAATASQH